MTKEFGSEVAFLVDGVTKLTQLNWDKDKVEIQAENLRKMFLAMAKDIASSLSSWQTVSTICGLENTGSRRSRRKRPERHMEIYAPIADRLGISKIKIELDDLSLKFLHPDVYYDVVRR